MKELHEPTWERHDAAVHEWFGLTYSSYLVLQRSLLQEMPTEWQERFVACIEEIRDYFDCDDMPSTYTVLLRDETGKFVRDPLVNYRHPDMDYINSKKRIKPKGGK